MADASGAMGAGGGFLQGLNSVLLPYLHQQNVLQGQQALQQNAITKKKVQSVMEEMDHLGLYHPEENPTHRAAHDWLLTPGLNPTPPEIAEFISMGEHQVNEAFMNVGQPPPSTPTATPKPSPTTTVAPNGMDMAASAQSLQKAGLDSAVLGDGGVVAGATEPEVVAPPATPVQRATKKLEGLREQNISFSHKVGGFTYTVQGLSFNAKEKTQITRAYDQVKKGADWRTLTDGMTPAAAQIVAKSALSDRFEKLVGLKIPMDTALGIVQTEAGSPENLPDRLYDMIYGPQIAAAKASATGAAGLSAKKEMAQFTQQLQEGPQAGAPATPEAQLFEPTVTGKGFLFQGSKGRDALRALAKAEVQSRGEKQDALKAGMLAADALDAKLTPDVLTLDKAYPNTPEGYAQSALYTVKQGLRASKVGKNVAGNQSLVEMQTTADSALIPLARMLGDKNIRFGVQMIDQAGKFIPKVDDSLYLARQKVKIYRTLLTALSGLAPDDSTSAEQAFAQASEAVDQAAAAQPQKRTLKDGTVIIIENE